MSFYANSNDFKVYTLDVDLLRRLTNLPASVVMGEDNIWSNFGGFFAEQFIVQQLRSLGFDETFYWMGNADNSLQPKGKSEVDFIVSFENQIIPIEVKSGYNVKAKSLRVYRKKYHPSLSIRFSLKDIEYNEGLLNIPLHYSFLLNDLMRQKTVLRI